MEKLICKHLSSYDFRKVISLFQDMWKRDLEGYVSCSPVLCMANTHYKVRVSCMQRHERQATRDVGERC